MRMLIILQQVSTRAGPYTSPPSANDESTNSKIDKLIRSKTGSKTSTTSECASSGAGESATRGADVPVVLLSKKQEAERIASQYNMAGSRSPKKLLPTGSKARLRYVLEQQGMAAPDKKARNAQKKM